MRRLLFVVSVVAVVLAGSSGFNLSTAAQDTPAGADPSAGKRGHFDLAIHFPWDPAAIAHHWCKPVAGDFTECLIYASDAPDAPLVAVEEVVPEAIYNSFDPAEQQRWHSNVVEAAAGSDPDHPAPSLEEAAAKANQSGGATYGKLILLFDPTQGDLPTGEPRVVFPHGTEPGAPTP
jgi:uncharacterized protein DUF1264